MAGVLVLRDFCMIRCAHVHVEYLHHGRLHAMKFEGKLSFEFVVQCRFVLLPFVRMCMSVLEQQVGICMV
jgi:hypothetical protein